MSVTCRGCGSKIAAPSRTWSFVDKAEKGTGLVERTVGIYECMRCHVSIPHVFSKELFTLVKAKEWEGLRYALSSSENERQMMAEKVQALEGEREKLLKEIRLLKERVALEAMEAEVGILEAEVSGLKQGREFIEAEIRSYS